MTTTRWPATSAVGGMGRRAVRIAVCAVVSVASLATHVEGASAAATACTAKTYNAYGRLPGSSTNLARVTIKMSVCWSTTAPFTISSAHCTFGIGVSGTKTSAVSGQFYKRQEGGAGSRGFLCYYARTFRYDRPAPQKDLFARPSVDVLFDFGRIGGASTRHDSFR